MSKGSCWHFSFYLLDPSNFFLYSTNSTNDNSDSDILLNKVNQD